MDRATAYLHFRSTDVQKAEILKRAKAEGKSLSAYLLGRALGDGGAAVLDSQAEAERVPGSTGASAPVAEPPANAEAQSHPSPNPNEGETREEFIQRRMRALYGRGFTSRHAKIEAEREWRAVHAVEQQGRKGCG